MVLTPHGGVNRCETRSESVLRVMMRRRSALKTRHHSTTKYTSTILAAFLATAIRRCVRHVRKGKSNQNKYDLSMVLYDHVGTGKSDSV